MRKLGDQGSETKEISCRPKIRIEVNSNEEIDLTIEEAADNMKLSLWRVMQGIKNELLVSVLSRVVAKEISLEEMVTEFNK